MRKLAKNSEPENYPKRMGHPSPPSTSIPWRGILTLPLVLLYAFFFAGFLSLCGLLFPTWFRNHFGVFAPLWGKGILNILGIRLQVRGAEHLQNGPAVVFFNHVSVLDLPLLAAVWENSGTMVYKKEFRRIPIIGHLMRQMGFIAIDRSNRKSAKKSLEHAAQKVVQDKRVLFLSPEGTRSKGQGLLPFKKGPFHVALATKAPVIPLIMRGFETVVPGDSWFARQGTIEIELLAPIATDHWTKKTLPIHVEDMRNIFLRHLPTPSMAFQAAAALGP